MVLISTRKPEKSDLVLDLVIDRPVDLISALSTLFAGLEESIS